MTLKEKAFEESPQAKKMLERANFLANDLLEKANVKAEALLDKINHQAVNLLDKANDQAEELITKANSKKKNLLAKAKANEEVLLEKADAVGKTLVEEASFQANNLLSEAKVVARDFVKERELESKDDVIEAITQANDLVLNADEQARVLVSEADKQAKILLNQANDQAKVLVSEADEQAKDLLQKASLQAKELVRDAAMRAKDLINEAAVHTKDFVKVVAIQAKELVTEAASIYIENKLKFLDIASHELRTPVTRVSLLLQHFERQIEKGKPVTSAAMKQIRSPVDRLSKLIHSLIEMSRFETNLVRLIPVKISMVSLIFECLEEFRVLVPECNFIFKGSDQLVEISLDPIRINQVLFNILDNAVKYGRREDGQTIIETTLQVLPDRVRVTIKDFGVGIPKEQQTKIFGLFARGSSNATVLTSGLGLGLSISRRIIKLHKGAIGVFGNKGDGCSFYFELPLDGHVL